MDKGSEEMCPQLSPVQPGGQFATIAPNVNSNISVSQTTRRRYPFLSQNGPSGHDQYRRIETNTPQTPVKFIPSIMEFTVKMQSPRWILQFREILLLIT